jgi:hypothetical protein
MGRIRLGLLILILESFPVRFRRFPRFQVNHIRRLSRLVADRHCDRTLVDQALQDFPILREGALRNYNLPGPFSSKPQVLRSRTLIGAVEFREPGIHGSRSGYSRGMPGDDVPSGSGYCRMRGFRMRFQGRGADGSFERLFLAEAVGYLRI